MSKEKSERSTAWEAASDAITSEVVKMITDHTKNIKEKVEESKINRAIITLTVVVDIVNKSHEIATKFNVKPGTVAFSTKSITQGNDPDQITLPLGQGGKALPKSVDDDFNPTETVPAPKPKPAKQTEPAKAAPEAAASAPAKRGRKPASAAPPAPVRFEDDEPPAEEPPVEEMP